MALGCLVFGCRKFVEQIEKPVLQGPPPIEGYALLHGILREVSHMVLLLWGGWLRPLKWGRVVRHGNGTQKQKGCI